MGQYLIDNCGATLAHAIGTGDTSVGVRAGEGAQFESAGALSASNYLIATLVKVSGYREVAWEIVKITGRSTDDLTVVRAQEGSTALSFAAGDRIEVRLTAADTACINRAQTWTQTQTVSRSDASSEFVSIGDGQAAGFKAYRYSANTGAPGNYLYKARGSLASPGAVQAGDFSCIQYALFHDGQAFRYGTYFGSVVEAIAGTDDIKVGFEIATRPAGAAAGMVVRIRFAGDGNVGIGTTSPSTSLHVNGPIRCGSYTVATVPAAATVGAGTSIYVSNESGGAVMAFSDGTNWRRVTDRAVIS